MTKLFTFYLVWEPFLVKFGGEIEREGMKGENVYYERERKREIYTPASTYKDFFPHTPHD